ncbi:MAG TPA: SDR family oxidoreductase [Dermatophilaceae bacterium]|nr:SDR family oxidoreductase [Dermatophilaceae bacterium]
MFPRRPRGHYHVPNQHGRRVVITGANSGIGLETARRLAVAGAEVVLAVRDLDRGRSAAADIAADAPGATLLVQQLDLASLASVRAAAADLLGQDRPIDALVNNAGVMAIPARRVTIDGWETQFATNYLGHFALTGLVLPLLRRGVRARVVYLGSMAAWFGRLRLDDLNAEHGYHAWTAYAQSKLAMIMAANELHRRSGQYGWGLSGVSAHPGYSRTNLQAAGRNFGKAHAGPDTLENRIAGFFGVVMDPAEGALGTIRAASDPDVLGGRYYGPTGFGGTLGSPGVVRQPPPARNAEVARRLWERSVDLTGVDYGEV